MGAIPANIIPSGSSYALDNMFVGTYPGSPVSMYESNVTFFSVNSLDPSEHTLQITLVQGDAPFMLDYVAYQPISSNPLGTSTSSMSSSAMMSSTSSTSSSVMMSEDTSSTAMSSATSSSTPVSSSSSVSTAISSTSASQTAAGSSATTAVARSSVVHTSQIAGGVVGGLVALLLLVLLLLRCCKRKGWGFYKHLPGRSLASSDGTPIYSSFLVPSTNRSHLQAGSSAGSIRELHAGNGGITTKVPLSISGPQPSNVQFPLPVLQSNAVRIAYDQQPEAGPSSKPLPALPPLSPFSVSSPRIQRAMQSPPNSARGKKFRVRRKAPVEEEGVPFNFVAPIGDVGSDTSSLIPSRISSIIWSRSPRVQSFNSGQPSTSTSPLRQSSST